MKHVLSLVVLLVVSCASSPTPAPAPPRSPPLGLVEPISYGDDSTTRCVSLFMLACEQGEVCGGASIARCMGQAVRCLYIDGIEENEAAACGHAIASSGCYPDPVTLAAACDGIGEQVVAPPPSTGTDRKDL